MKCRFCSTTKNLVKDCHYTYKDKLYQYYSCRYCNTKRHHAWLQTPSGKSHSLAASQKYQYLHPEKYNSWKIANYRLKTKLPCEICGKQPAQKHHPDPLKPLEVIYLCPLHHVRKHLL